MTYPLQGAQTVKDLSKCLANPCFVTNCGEGLDYRAMAAIFSGLVQSGAWGCFDECVDGDDHLGLIPMKVDHLGLDHSECQCSHSLAVFFHRVFCAALFVRPQVQPHRPRGVVGRLGAAADDSDCAQARQGAFRVLGQGDQAQHALRRLHHDEPRLCRCIFRHSSFTRYC